MTKATKTLPLTISLQIPTYWTPEQAFVVFELIDDLRDAIWRCYAVQPRPVSRPTPAARRRSPQNRPRRSAVLTRNGLQINRGGHHGPHLLSETLLRQI